MKKIIKNKIGTLKEKSLHKEIKQWYKKSGDRIEQRVENFIIDVVRDNQLIEIQTKNFFAIKRKLNTLLQKHRLTLLYPIPVVKWIVKICVDTGKIKSRRKSPKQGTIFDLFDELLSIPDLINNSNFSLEVLLIEAEEIRCADGKGSWRRNGVSIIDKKMLTVMECQSFSNNMDFLKIIPATISRPFTNKSLAAALNIKPHKAQKITYCLKKMGTLKIIGKKRNAYIYDAAV